MVTEKESGGWNVISEQYVGSSSQNGVSTQFAFDTTEGFVIEEASITIEVLANDTDLDNNHTFTLDSVTSAKGGVSIVNNALVFEATAADFDHLAAGVTEDVVITYIMSDENAATSTSTTTTTTTTTTTITVTGTNDMPVVAGALTSDTLEGDAAFVLDLLTGASDADNGETETLQIANITYEVDGQTSGLPSGLTLSGHTLMVDPTNTAFDSLGYGEKKIITVNYDVTDEQGGMVAQTETITINGTQAGPKILFSGQGGRSRPVAPMSFTPSPAWVLISSSQLML